MAASLRQQRDQASLYLLFALFVLLPVTAVFGHRGVAPWLLLAALPAFVRGDFWQTAFGAVFDRLNLRDPVFAGFAAMVFFCIWIFLSGFWSPKGQPSLALWVLAPALVGASVVWFSLHLSPLWRYRLSVAFAISIAAGFLVLLFEGLSGGFLRSLLPPLEPSERDAIALGRGVTALAPALFPAAAIAAMLRGRLTALAVLALGAAAALCNDIQVNIVAMGLGALFAAVAYKAPRSALAGLGGALIVLLALAPLAALIPVDAAFAALGDVLPASWLQRLSIWQTSAARIFEELPFGAGADATRIWSQSSPMIDIPGAAAPLPARGVHPHNLFLQVWVELGLPGVILLGTTVFCAATILTRAQVSRGVAACIGGALVVFFATFMVGGSLWEVWRLASLALAAMGAALAYALRRTLRE